MPVCAETLSDGKSKTMKEFICRSDQRLGIKSKCLFYIYFIEKYQIMREFLNYLFQFFYASDYTSSMSGTVSGLCALMAEESISYLPDANHRLQS